MISLYESQTYQKGIEEQIWAIESKPTRRIWEYSRKYKESLAYLDSSDKGSLLVGYADHMQISLRHAAQIIIWKYEQYQDAILVLDRARRAKDRFVAGMDSQAASDLFDQVCAELKDLEEYLADPS